MGPGQYMPLPHPLYEEFLHLDVRSLDDILNFMAAHVMIGSLGVRPDKRRCRLCQNRSRKDEEFASEGS